MKTALALCLSLLFLSKIGSAATLSLSAWKAPSPPEKRCFRQLAPEIDDASFDGKWQHARQSPSDFFRSFARFYYLGFKGQDDLGPVGPCFGDAHAENFGFLRFPDGTHFTFNDLDDSATCPVSVDALRYFTALRLFDPAAAVGDLIEQYAAITLGASPGVALPTSFFPDLDKRRLKLIKEGTRKNAFLLGGKVRALSRELRQELRSTLDPVLKAKQLTLKDLVRYPHDHGGSAGLARYWLLVETADGLGEILELKEETTPAPVAGGWPLPPEFATNWAPWAAKHFLAGNPPSYWQTIAFRGKRFLLRSRTQKALAFDDYDREKRHRIYQAELTLLAQGHARTWQSGGPTFDAPGITCSLQQSSETLAAEMRSLWKQLH